MTNNMQDTIKGVRGLRRAAHFANGGTLAEWRGGLSTQIPNKRREQARKACRGRDE